MPSSCAPLMHSSHVQRQTTPLLLSPAHCAPDFSFLNVMLPNSVTSRFPNRRRAAQACVACRMRKTRCDAVQPRCGFCALHNIDCVYRDAQQPRIDYNTQVLLERIQQLEDRLTGHPPGQQPAATAVHQPPSRHDEPVAELDVQIALSHTANANHVFSWPFVQQLIGEVAASEQRPKGDATDIFFEAQASATPIRAASSWSLFDDMNHPDMTADWRSLIDLYFSEVNVFFPLLSKSRLIAILESADINNQGLAADHLLLLLVLCLAVFVKDGGNIVRLGGSTSRERVGELENCLWSKAKLLLGFISADITLQSAQCAMIARRVDSHHSPKQY